MRCRGERKAGRHSCEEKQIKPEEEVDGREGKKYLDERRLQILRLVGEDKEM